MAYLIGTDEAGYGPNLGPLVVAASVWEVPGDAHFADLARLLADCVTDGARTAAVEGQARVVIGDSKRLYQSGKGLQQLELGLWPALRCLGFSPRSWREVWQCLAPDSAADHAALWFAGYDPAAPFDAPGERLAVLTAAFPRALEQAGVRLLGLRCRAMFPEQFNRRLAECTSKGTVLSQLTLRLAAELIAPLPEGPIRILCDKHGGRNHYQDLLAEWFPDSFIEICGESTARSVYRFGPAKRRIEFRFEAHGESHLPTALASMAAKYLRELAMRAWNEFWIRYIPGLAATAGYPQDAPRFKAAIAPFQQQLGIADATIWRIK
jgi:hypothetical protein